MILFDNARFIAHLLPVSFWIGEKNQTAGRQSGSGSTMQKERS
ncbi:hypothetical protein AmDm5_2566 [Acetobacter malorum]|nr:hypothetical protein AmDm5_2566 [Acetobacter malorum]